MKINLGRIIRGYVGPGNSTKGNARDFRLWFSLFPKYNYGMYRSTIPYGEVMPSFLYVTVAWNWSLKNFSFDYIFCSISKNAYADYKDQKKWDCLTESQKRIWRRQRMVMVSSSL